MTSDRHPARRSTGTLIHVEAPELVQRVAGEAVLTRFDTDWSGDSVS